MAQKLLIRRMLLVKNWMVGWGGNREYPSQDKKPTAIYWENWNHWDRIKKLTV